MHAVILTGGKQYTVEEGDMVDVELLQSDNTSILFDKILLVANGDNVTIGAPFVDGAKVNAEIVKQFRGKKVRILKFKRRKHHMKQMGHRQYLTKIKIIGIELVA
jgi:large subunit ribosomal protein L21